MDHIISILQNNIRRDIYKGCNPDSLDINLLEKQQKYDILGSGSQTVFCYHIRQELKRVCPNRRFLVCDTKQFSCYSTKFDQQYGDFIIYDVDNNEITYFDLKVTTKQGFRGTIELSSLDYVYSNKWFISLDYDGSFCLINSKDFKEWINNPNLLNNLKSNPICTTHNSNEKDFYFSWVINMYITRKKKLNQVV